MGNNIRIRFVHSWDEEEIADLYREGGWWKEEYPVDDLRHLIRGSSLFAVAVDENSGKAVGMGRVISDGVSDGYIQDLVIRKEYRNSGVGRTLVESLVTRCKEAGLTWIGLIAEPRTEQFYLPLGFEVMNGGHTPLIYRGEE